MRMVRTAAKAVAALTLVPGLLVAQADTAASTTSNFNDSWFWGVNGGVMMFTAGVNQNVQVTAPAIGGEWLITRTRMALRVSIQQAFFDEQAVIFDPSAPNSMRPVDIEDWRRYSAEIHFIPKVFGSMRPYLGLGLALNVLQETIPGGSFTSPEQADTVFSAVSEFGTRASAVFLAGTQWNVGRSGVFFQASAMPTRHRFLFSRSHYSFVLEGGIRYNFGSAIEKF